MKILTTITCCREDVQRAETLVDLIYQLSGRKQKGHCLLVFAPEVHEESKTKLKLAAELAFEGVELFPIKTLVTVGSDKPAAIHAMFQQVAQYVASNYRWPWLWLEPDCMPLTPNWREKLADAFDNQPKRYLGRKLQTQGGEFFISRVGVYPANILNDVDLANVSGVYYHASIVEKTTNSPLLQEGNITSASDVSKVRPDAVLLHRDKEGVLADWVREKVSGGQINVAELIKETFKEQNKAKQWHGTTSEAIVSPPPKRGRPPKVKSELATV